MPMAPNPSAKKRSRTSGPSGRPRVGLVLGSGGARGVVHISVIESLLELGIPIDLIAGSSIGAVVGGVYASGGLQAFKKDMAELRRDEILRLFDPVLSLSGLFAARKTMGFLERYIPKTTKIEQCSLPLAVVATDYDLGHPVVFRKGNLLDAIRASMSIPGIFTPARFGASLLIDGGVSDPLPIDVASAMGADLTIAVSLQPALGNIGLISKPSVRAHRMGRLSDHLPKSPLAEDPGWLMESERWLGTKTVPDGPARHPNVFEILFRAIDIMGYTNTMMMLTAHPPTVLLEFDFPEIPTLDFTKCTELLEEGRKAVSAKRNEIIEKIGSAVLPFYD
jgi:NTE family protein